MIRPGGTARSVLLRLDLRLVCVILILVIAVMTALWRPWQPTGEKRTITISGEATLKAEPDEFVFSPYYERGTIDETTKLSTELVAKLKALGVDEADIMVNASSYDKIVGIEPASPTATPATTTSTLQITVTLSDKELAQKVQDYLLTTSPKGSISPSATFSNERRKSLEDEARSQAIADARKQADATAAGLKVSIGKVVEVKDNESAGVMPYYGVGDTSSMSVGGAMPQSLKINVGQQEYTYRVQVVFELK